MVNQGDILMYVLSKVRRYDCHKKEVDRTRRAQPVEEHEAIQQDAVALEILARSLNHVEVPVLMTKTRKIL